MQKETVSVESPYEMGAASMAQRIIRPTVTKILNPEVNVGRSKDKS